MGGGQRRAPRAQCGGGTGHGPSAAGLGAVKAGAALHHAEQGGVLVTKR